MLVIKFSDGLHAISKKTGVEVLRLSIQEEFNWQDLLNIGPPKYKLTLRTPTKVLRKLSGLEWSQAVAMRDWMAGQLSI